jgi:hypothetical protein
MVLPRRPRFSCADRRDHGGTSASARSGDGATIVATLRSASEATVKSVTKAHAGNYFEQTTLDSFLGGAPVSGKESLTLQTPLARPSSTARPSTTTRA